ncbi:MAG: TetR/AcrR family transcriptional regulator [Ruminococcaceae bacterium]|nr:TetR/AcrR family transcriptional regulator [Oscillospiraceae bacterium]
MQELGGTKQAIFEAAVNLFARDNYHHVSVRQIAKTVGIMASSIYNHYASKEAILLDIYDYFDTNMARLMPDLGTLMQMAETAHPHDVLRATTVVYPQAIVPTMAKAMLVTASMTSSDPRAEDLIHRNLIEMPYLYDIPLLNKMMDLDRIEPLDAESFALMHSCYCHSAAVRFYGSHGIDTDTWIRGMELLFGRVVVKQPAHA